MIIKHLQKFSKIFQKRNKIYVCKKIAVYLYQDKGTKGGREKTLTKWQFLFISSLTFG